MSKQITAIVVGAGHRGLTCARYALNCPDEFKIVGVADPSEFRRKQTAEIHGFGPEDVLRERPGACLQRQTRRRGDQCNNGHRARADLAAAVAAGYDILLEKPIATYESESGRYSPRAQVRSHRDDLHVLRYAPYYAAIRQRVLDGEIGDLVSVLSQENVSYHHMACSHVRGKWARSDTVFRC